MSVPILMYHRIAPINRLSLVPGHYVHPRAFARQMKLLARRGYTPISLSRLFVDPMPRKPIVITFDDGYENFLSNALPILEAGGFPATVFLVSSLVGGSNVWDRAAGDVEEKLMTWDEVRTAESKGIEFGSHTCTHADLSAVSGEEADRQIAGSKAEMEANLGHPIDTFCYPYGRRANDTAERVSRAGYRWACSTEKGLNTPHTDPMALKRINVRSDTSLPVFLYKLCRRSPRG